MRNAILNELYRPDGTYISGESLAAKLGISRVAVWKHIEALKEEGYDIAAASGKGYRLRDCNSIVLPGQLKNLLNTRFMARNYYYFPQVDSTNAMARRMLKGAGIPPGTVVAAGRQTGGKGRRGHFWDSPPGGLWFTLILNPQLPLQQTALLSLACAVGVCRALPDFLDGGKAEIKWPNDIMVNGHKMAGILLETAGEVDAAEYVIAGIGVNTNIAREQLTTDVQDKATSLLMQNGHPVDNARLLSAILAALEDVYDCFLKEGFETLRQQFKSCCCHLGQIVRVDTGMRVIEGINSDIDDYGSLVVDLGTSQVKVTTGEVCLVKSREE